MGSNSSHNSAIAKVRALEVFELYKTGKYTYQQLAVKFEVGLETIRRDINNVVKKITKGNILDLEEMKIEARERMNHLLKECVEGYEASKEFTTKKIKKIDTSKESGTISEIEVGHGDIRFLQLAKDILDSQNDLFGLKPQASNGPVGISQVFDVGGGKVEIKTSWATGANAPKLEQEPAKQIETQPQTEEAEFEEIEDED